MDASVKLIPTNRDKCRIPLWTPVFRTKLIFLYLKKMLGTKIVFRFLTRFSLYIFRLVFEDVKAFGQLICV